MNISSKYNVGDKVFFVDEMRSKNFDEVMSGVISEIGIRADTRDGERLIVYDTSITSINKYKGSSVTREEDKVFSTEEEANYYQVKRFLDGIETMIATASKEQRSMINVGLYGLISSFVDSREQKK